MYIVQWLEQVHTLWLPFLHVEMEKSSLTGKRKEGVKRERKLGGRGSGAGVRESFLCPSDRGGA